MIYITGSNGQLGFEFKRLLKEDAIFLSRNDLDLSNPDSVKKFLGTTKINTLINTAAYTQVDKAETDIDTARAINCISPALIAEYAKDRDFKFVHFSTDYVFNGTSQKAYTEEESTDPVNKYGLTKLEGEKAILAVCPTSIIIRTSWVYSSHGKNFIKTILKAGAEREELRVVSDQIGTLTWAKDLAEVTLKAVNKELQGIYHYSGEGVSSWYDVAVYLKNLSGFKANVLPVTTLDYPTPAKRPQFSLLDKTKIKKDLNLQIPSWMDSLESFYQTNTL